MISSEVALKVSVLTHFGAVSTLCLYIAMVLAMLRCVRVDGLTFTMPDWVWLVHWIARAGVLLLLLLGMFMDATRGGQFLWIACGVEGLSCAFVAVHPMLRLGVVCGTIALLVSSSVLSHWGMDMAGDSGIVFVLAHIIPAILAEALLVLCAVCGAAYLLQSYLIKHHRVEVLLSRMPSLQRLERWMQSSALLGFSLMSLSLVLGGAGAASKGSFSFMWDWTQLVAVLVWIVLGSLVVLRSVRGWSVRNNAFLVCIGVPLIFLLSFMTLLYDGGKHHRSVEVQLEQ